MIQIAGYQITDKIYSGTRNSVYRGKRLDDSKAVVIKVMNALNPSSNEILEFCNQYAIAAILKINGIVQPLALLNYENRYALILEDTDGISLQEYIDNIQTQEIKTIQYKNIDKFIEIFLQDFLQIAIQIVDIIDELISHRVIHNAIKPTNILINPKSKLIQLIDFSTAYLIPKERQQLEKLNRLEGTIECRDPEQTGIIDKGIDYRADFYSLGITLYKWLSKQLSLVSDDKKLLHSHINILQDNSNKIPQVISDIVIKLMAKNAKERYQSASGLKYDLEKCLYQLKKTGKIEYFEIGKRDICSSVSEKLPEELPEEISEELYITDKVQKRLTEPHQESQQGFPVVFKQSEERFRYLFESTPKIAMQCYNRHRQVIAWNKASEILYGYSQTEALGKQIEDLIIPPPMRELVIEAIEKWITEEIPIPAKELDLMHKDGSKVSVYSTHIMVRNSANEPEMYCLDIDTRDFYKELHLRKRVEQALLNSEEKFRRLFEMTADAVMLLDKDGFLDCNTAALDIFGCQSKKEFCGKHPSDFSPLKQPNGEYSDKLEAQNIQIALSKGIYRFEWQHRRSDASEFSAEVLLSRIEINGKEILQAFVRDITERKAAEAAIKQKSQQLEQALQELQQTQLQLVQSEKMSALGNLVAGVAHEINNPVGFIAGNITEAMTAVKDITEYLKLYQETFPNPGNKIAQKAEEFEIGYLLEDLPKMLNSMEVGCDRIINISTSLRVFSRADKDYKVLFNIHTGIDSTILILKHRLKYNEQRPEINIIIEYGEIPEIKCFPGEINQVFMNIIANAIDALDESNKGLSFAEIVANPNQIIIKTSLEGQYVKISIADNGKGMSKEIQEKVFDRLFTTKEIGKGTGLGLAIAHHIVVNKHGGSLQVNSELDKGTEFAIALPIDDINENCKIS